MYPTYDIYSTGNVISTLDLHSVALISSWMNSSKTQTPIYQQISLPPNIPFEHAPIKNHVPNGISDIPLFRFLEVMFSLYSQPVFLVPIIVFLVVMIVLGYGAIKKSKFSNQKQ